jgi:hypothetical protein
VWLFTSEACGQDRLILRDTKVIDGAVTALSPDGVTIDIAGKPNVVGWDELEAGKVGKQAEFDKSLKDIGDPLFRVRQRLKTGDYRELLDPAEKLFPTFAGRSSPVAETVCVATAFARLANNKREAAAEPFLATLAIRSRNGFVSDSRFATLNNRKLALNTKAGTWLDLTPIWFDPAAAKQALPRVEAQIKEWPGGKPPFTAYLYAFTLALTAGDLEAANRHDRDLRTFSTSAEWVLIVDAQREVITGKPGDSFGRLEAKLEALPEPLRMIGTYWLGTGQLLSNEVAVKKRGLVWLLHLPAKYAEAEPDLAAAGLYFASKTLDELKDARGAVTLRGELLTGFRQTYHGAKLAAETAPPKKDRP